MCSILKSILFYLAECRWKEAVFLGNNIYLMVHALLLLSAAGAPVDWDEIPIR